MFIILSVYIRLILMTILGLGAFNLAIPEDKKVIWDIRKRFRYFVKEKDLITKATDKATLDDIEIKPWGFRSTLDISKICAYEDIEKHSDYIKQLFRAKEVKMTNKKGTAIIEVINQDIGDIKYSYADLPPYQLLLGYDKKGIQIIVDMKKTPHIGVQGASNSGKSKMIELALRNVRGKADVIMLNCFEDDFTSIPGRRIANSDDILEYLESIIEEPYVRKRPLYLLLDELNVLGKDKKINKAIMDVLSQARHFNIFLIALGQSLLKENCPYKQLFNVRVTFRAIDRSSIGAFLGCTVENTQLNQREFICYSDNIYRGKSYLL